MLFSSTFPLQMIDSSVQLMRLCHAIGADYRSAGGAGSQGLRKEQRSTV